MVLRASVRTSVLTIACLSLVAGIVPAAAQGPQDPVVDRAGAYQGWGDPGGFYNIAPAGQDGVLNVAEIAEAQATGEAPEHVDDQLELYAGLIREGVTPGFTAEKLDAWFKAASFGVREGDVPAPTTPVAATT